MHTLEGQTPPARGFRPWTVCDGECFFVKNPLNVTVHESRVTTVQRRIEPWRHLPIASVDVTCACSAQCYNLPGSGRFSSWLRGDEKTGPLFEPRLRGRSLYL